MNGSSYFVLRLIPEPIPGKLCALRVLSPLVVTTYILQEAKLASFDPISRPVRRDLDAAVKGAKEGMLLRLQYDPDVSLPYNQISRRRIVCACESREPLIETTRGRILIGNAHTLIERMHKVGTIQLSSTEAGPELDQKVRCGTTVSGGSTRTLVGSRFGGCYDKTNADEKNCERVSEHGVDGREILRAEWVEGRCGVSTSQLHCFQSVWVVGFDVGAAFSRPLGLKLNVLASS